MDFARCVESLLATPRRKRREPVAGTPHKVRRTESDCIGIDFIEEANDKEPSATAPHAAEEVTERDAAVLATLFEGLESELVYLASRRGRPSLEVVRQHVEIATRRCLTDERLEQLLAVAGCMLDVVCVGEHLELVQRVEGGEVRPPSSAERAVRRAAFAAALAAARQRAAANRGPLPRRPLPPRHSFSAPVPRTVPPGGTASAPAASAAPQLLRSACEGAESAAAEAPAGSGSRLLALRGRVLERQASNRSVAAHRARLGELERRISSCEDAMAAHAVLVQLFARGEGVASAACETEILSAIGSGTFAAQCRRPIDAVSAGNAVELLLSSAAGWFEVHTPQYSQRVGRLLNRLPGGSSAAALDALRAELRRLQDEHGAIVAQGADQPEAATGDAALALAGLPDAPGAREAPPPAAAESSAEHESASAPTSPMRRLRRLRKGPP